VSWIRPDRIANFKGKDSAPDGSTKRSPDFEQAVEEALEQMQSGAEQESSQSAAGLGSASSQDDADDDDGDLGSSSESDSGDSDEGTSSDAESAAPSKSNVNGLKAKYKTLKGSAARGSMANNADWLQARIDEMERSQSSAPKPGLKKKPGAAAKHTKAAKGKPGDASGSQSANVTSLKQRYKQLKGTAPRGPKVNDAAWLQAKVAELEATQSANVDAMDDSSEESDLGTAT
jgi:hypothetical protein